MNIGSAIRSIRKRLDISQHDLAVKCELSQTSLSQIENGVKFPTQRTINRLCTALDIPEPIVYIVAMQEQDVSESKKAMFHLIYPSIRSLAFKIVSPDGDHKEYEA